MKHTHLALLAAVIALWSMPARAQVPFVGAGVGIFDPEIGVVQSGVILDAQAVVSADRKYVTMTTRFQDAQLLNLREFAFQTGGGAAGGQVGGAGNVGAAGAANVNGRGAAEADNAANNSGRPTGRSQHALPRKQYPAPGKPKPVAAESVLDKEGMTLLSKVQAPSDR